MKEKNTFHFSPSADALRYKAEWASRLLADVILMTLFSNT
jgi:hypothetical protein